MYRALVSVESFKSFRATSEQSMGKFSVFEICINKTEEVRTYGASRKFTI